ncbi:hypothetical protein BJ912DRAFT_1061496 [Pholiota molesta]|nr:hypothetical protein BJ912DRAFT_1061496 [Pholiota molesta]
MSWPFLSPSFYVGTSKQLSSTQDLSTSSSAALEKPQRASSGGENIDSPQDVYGFSKGFQYNDVSDIFTEAEYREIKSCYDTMGLESWKDLIAKPVNVFHARNAQVKDLCEKLENFNMAPSQLRQVGRKSMSSKRNGLRVLLEESSEADAGERDSRSSSLSSPWTSAASLEEIPPLHTGDLASGQAPPKVADKRDSSIVLLSPNTTLTHDKKARKIKRAKSTSSSSSYGSASSARSRSSWSSHAGEFPYAYPSSVPGPELRSFSDSDDYLRRKTQSPTAMQPNYTTTEYYSPLTMDAPPLPSISVTSPPLYLQPNPSNISQFSPSKSCPVQPTPKRRGFSRLFHIFRRNKKA